MSDEEADAIQSQNVEKVERMKRSFLLGEETNVADQCSTSLACPTAGATDLDQVHDAVSPDELDTSRPLIGYILTVRNQLNGVYIQRPENMGSNDVWNLDFKLGEFPSPEAAWQKYRALRQRRKKLVDEDSKEIDHGRYFLQKLNDLSQKDREWRSKRDALDRKLERTSLVFRPLNEATVSGPSKELQNPLVGRNLAANSDLLYGASRESAI